MIQLAHASKAPVPRSEEVKVVAWLYVAILVIMAISQLFAFEDLIPLMATYSLPGGYGSAVLASCMIVLTEIFAVPFLLRMPLSVLMRWVGLVCSVLVPVFWLKLIAWSYINGIEIGNSGFLGTKVVLPVNSIMVCVSVALLAIAIWVAWGLWPARKSK